MCALMPGPLHARPAWATTMRAPADVANETSRSWSPGSCPEAGAEGIGVEDVEERAREPAKASIIGRKCITAGEKDGIRFLSSSPIVVSVDL